VNFHERTIKQLHEIASSVPRVSRGRLAAAVVYRREIVAIGFNQYKTHPLQKLYAKNSDSICLHAEVHAISRASKVLKQSEFGLSSIYIARSKLGPGKAEVFGLARPCPGCFSCILAFGIRKVCYTNNNGEFEWLKI